MTTTTSGIDVILSLHLQKGRMNAIKTSLTNAILIIEPTATVIDAWRMQTWNFSSFVGILVSIKLNPSKLSRLSYASRLPNKYFGQYMVYHFSLHVIARYQFEEELESHTAYDAANAIITYLRTHNKDEDHGVLDIWNVTGRESDPSGGGRAGAHMSRIIIEGYVLAERPFQVVGD